LKNLSARLCGGLGPEEVALWAVGAARVWEHRMSVANVLLLPDAWRSVSWWPGSGDSYLFFLQPALYNELSELFILPFLT